MAASPRPCAAAADGGPGGIRDETRARLLAAAARVYAQHGYLGATTRRIANEADVNEVTIFRLFRSKDALVDEAVHVHAVQELPAPLPEEPADPERELGAWCAGELARLTRAGDLLRHCFAEADTHPEHVHDASAGIVTAARAARAYAERLAARGLVSAPEHRDAAVAMLVSALVADGLARGQLPGVYPAPAADAPMAYARAFLATLGVRRAQAVSEQSAAGYPWRASDLAPAAQAFLWQTPD